MDIFEQPLDAYTIDLPEQTVIEIDALKRIEEAMTDPNWEAEYFASQDYLDLREAVAFAAMSDDARLEYLNSRE